MAHIINGDKNMWPCVLGGVAVGGLAALASAALLGQSCTKSSKKPSNLSLLYFEGRGLAEVSRTLLAVAGVDYNDKRYKFTVAEGEGSIFSRISKPEMDAGTPTTCFCNRIS
jgi:hypothetical protein